MPWVWEDEEEGDITCPSCWRTIYALDVSENDGFCPKCFCEICEEEDDDE